MDHPVNVNNKNRINYSDIIQDGSADCKGVEHNVLFTLVFTSELFGKFFAYELCGFSELKLVRSEGNLKLKQKEVAYTFADN